LPGGSATADPTALPEVLLVDPQAIVAERLGPGRQIQEVTCRLIQTSATSRQIEAHHVYPLSKVVIPGVLFYHIQISICDIKEHTVLQDWLYGSRQNQQHPAAQESVCGLALRRTASGLTAAAIRWARRAFLVCVGLYLLFVIGGWFM
jgi:hypothetical protein